MNRLHKEADAGNVGEGGIPADDRSDLEPMDSGMATLPCLSDLDSPLTSSERQQHQLNEVGRG